MTDTITTLKQLLTSLTDEQKQEMKDAVNNGIIKSFKELASVQPMPDIKFKRDDRE